MDASAENHDDGWRSGRDDGLDKLLLDTRQVEIARAAALADRARRNEARASAYEDRARRRLRRRCARLVDTRSVAPVDVASSCVGDGSTRQRLLECCEGCDVIHEVRPGSERASVGGQELSPLGDDVAGSSFR